MNDKTNSDTNESDHFKKWKNQKSNESKNGRIKTFLNRIANNFLLYGGITGSVYLNINVDALIDKDLRNKLITDNQSGDFHRKEVPRP